MLCSVFTEKYCPCCKVCLQSDNVLLMLSFREKYYPVVQYIHTEIMLIVFTDILLVVQCVHREIMSLLAVQWVHREILSLWCSRCTEK